MPVSASDGPTTARTASESAATPSRSGSEELRCPIPTRRGQGSIKLRVFLDKSVIEVFVDDGARVATNFIDCGVNDLGVELVARGGEAAFRSVDIWEMESIR